MIYMISKNLQINAQASATTKFTKAIWYVSFLLGGGGGGGGGLGFCLSAKSKSIHVKAGNVISLYFP